MSSPDDRIHTDGLPGLQCRREIHDLITDNVQFSLYIQALTRMFTPDPNDPCPQENPLSFFQIGGIHGLPPTPWDYSGGGESAGKWTGYCTHGTTIFPTWHRPYVVLFEQTLHANAVAIAEMYPIENRQVWQDKANTLRAPYWDWAKTAVPPDEVISKQTLCIETPDGISPEFPNPLLFYKFNPMPKSISETEWGKFPTTVRHPDKVTGATDVECLRRTLESNIRSIRLSLWRMFMFAKDWDSFSNHGLGHDDHGHVNSLEAIHDSMHIHIGDKGHMGNPSVAGFDPIFFLHHANVDRLLELWSALHPNVWVIPGPSRGGTWTISGSQTVDVNTELTPFRKRLQVGGPTDPDPSSYWPSSAIVSTNSFGYTYSEFEGIDMGNQDEIVPILQRKVNNLYGDSNLITFLTYDGPSGKLKDILKKVEPHNLSEPMAAVHDQGRIIHDWTVRVRVKEHDLGTSFSVLFFLGELPNNEHPSRSSPSYVGSYDTFVNSALDSCENCQSRADAGAIIEGYVHLNDKIAEVSDLDSFEPDKVSPYLKESLSWYVEKVGGVAVDIADIPSLEITVNASAMTLQVGDIVPRAGTPVFYHGITAGRLGGSRTAGA